MNLPKLVSVLATSELYLSSLASFAEDPWEGKYPPVVRQKLIDYYESEARKRGVAVNPNLSVPDWGSGIMRTSTYVNCWCMQDHELVAMWRIYGGTSGVALRTQYSLLREALPPSVFIGTVHYINPATDQFPTENYLHLVMHKRHFFSYEKECRVVKWEGEKVFEKPDEGQRLSFDLKKGIQRVVVSPLAPAWYKDCVTAVVERFAAWLPVATSEMIQ
jgi:hypothetical protein